MSLLLLENYVIKRGDNILIKNNHKPGNESTIHYELKQIAKYILKNKGCSIIGEEIDMGYCKYLADYPQFNHHKNSKSIIDTVGLIIKNDFYSSPKARVFKEPIFRTIGIESKATLQDFKNGFSTLCEKTFVIAPKKIIPIGLIPQNVGLIEVDLDKYEVTLIKGKFIFKGVKEVIKAKSNIDPAFHCRDKIVENKQYQHFCKKLLKTIGNRYTNENLYKRNEIQIKGL